MKIAYALLPLVVALSFPSRAHAQVIELDGTKIEVYFEDDPGEPQPLPFSGTPATPSPPTPTCGYSTGPGGTMFCEESAVPDLYPTCTNAMSDCVQNCVCPSWRLGSNLCTYTSPGTPVCRIDPGSYWNEVECTCSYSGTFLPSFPFPELCHSMAGGTFVQTVFACNWN